MKDLSTCQVCEGKLWKSKHKYYNGTYQMPEIIKLDKETDQMSRQHDQRYPAFSVGIDTDRTVDEIRVMTLPFLWAVKGFFSKKVVDIETIKICVMCFTASADHEKTLWRDGFGRWKPIHHKKHGDSGGTIIAYYLRTFERQKWYGDHQSGILNAEVGRNDAIMADIKDVLTKVSADTDKYRTLVTSLADKESGS